MDGSCVYTCLVGGYEKLNEQPMARASALPFICLTDDPGLTSETWKIVHITLPFALDPVRSQRMFKLLPYRHLGGFERSLYIDNSVVLTAPPDTLFADYLGNDGIAMPTHSFRETLRDEFTEVVACRLDDEERIADQLAEYEATDPAALDERPYWSGIMLRDHRDAVVRNAMELWMQQVLRFARRDQLSSNVSFRRAGLTPRRMAIDNYLSPFHRWPVTEERKLSARLFHSKRAAEIDRLTQEIAHLTQETGSLEARASAAETEVARLRDDVTRLNGDLSEETGHAQRMQGSLSWKVTAPLRAIRRLWPS